MQSFSERHHNGRNEKDSEIFLGKCHLNGLFLAFLKKKRIFDLRSFGIDNLNEKSIHSFLKMGDRILEWIP